MAGQSAGLVDDVVPVKELIDRIVAEAEAVHPPQCLSAGELAGMG